jgi:hypothetical protein
MDDIYSMHSCCSFYFLLVMFRYVATVFIYALMLEHIV